jgi:O-antigen/teichoic acid export membrane protein
MSESQSVALPDPNESTSEHGEQLTSGSRLAKNTAWNLIGNAAPMLVAFFSIPLVIKGLGTDRFGILTLVWALIGYASLFDLGLGRALTQLVATRLGCGKTDDIPSLVWTSLFLMSVMGVVGTIILFSFAPWIVRRVLHVPAVLEHETLWSVYLIGISIPFVISTSGLRGLLEAYQRFDLTTMLRVPMGALTFAGPIFVLPFSKGLFPVVGVLVGSRVLTWGAHLLLCFKVTPLLRRSIVWQSAAVRSLLRFGSWMTVSNVVGPLMVTLDRFIISSLLPVSEVAYYATPYEVVTKFWLVPSSLLGVVFPAFSTNFVRDRPRTTLLYSVTLKCLMAILFPMVLLIVILAGDGLKLWLGAEFAQHSVRTLQWLAIGAFVNCLAAAPFAVVQSVGRPDLTAKLHLIELPFYAVALFWLTKAQGIEGAAIAWTVRSGFDALVLFVLAKRFLPPRPSIRFQMPLFVGASLTALAVASVTRGLTLKSLFISATLLTFFAVIRFIVLSPEERNLARGFTHIL